MAVDYGRQTIPYGLNRIARRATGLTFVQLYDRFLQTLRRRYRRQRQQILHEDLVEGHPLTHHGDKARAPRFLCDGRIVYFASDGRTYSQLRTAEGEELVRAEGMVTPAPHPDGRSLYFGATAPYRDVYSFHDLFRYDLVRGETTRLTRGLRAREPDISPDGRQITFVIQSGGTSHLAIARLTNIEGTRRILVRSARHEHAYTPRFSPDGRTVAFSAWRRGGKRDIYLADARTGRVTAVTNDRALDTGPDFSPDGKWLYFSSDRSGIANIYAFHRESGRTYRVTNVLGGAYQPAIAGDGSRMVYIGYRSRGFDVYGLSLKENRPVRAEPYLARRSEPVDIPDEPPRRTRPYSPLPTLWPGNYRIDMQPDDFGYRIEVGLEGADAVGLHAYDVRLGLSLGRGEPVGDAGYSYRRWPVVPTVRFYRRIAERDDLFVSGRRNDWIEQVVGGSLGGSYIRPARFHRETFALTYSLVHTAALESGPSELDPNEVPPSVPETGYVPSVRISYRISDVNREVYEISPSSGQSLSLSLGSTDTLLGASYQSISLRWAVRKFISIPWLDRHVLALRYAGGHSVGDPGRRAVFGVGGFPDAAPFDSLYDLVFAGMIPALGGEALRGYPPSSRRGLSFHLLQTEYRLPLWQVDAGIHTLPLFFDRLYLVGFADYGDAFSDRFDIHTFRLGVGSELLFEIAAAYVRSLTLRLGGARGVSEGGQWQFYFHLGTPF
jgi:hypothetical protein